MTPEQRASEDMFGIASYKPKQPDLPHPFPDDTSSSEMVSWNELVEKYRNEETSK